MRITCSDSIKPIQNNIKWYKKNPKKAGSFDIFTVEIIHGDAKIDLDFRDIDRLEEFLTNLNTLFRKTDMQWNIEQDARQ